MRNEKELIRLRRFACGLRRGVVIVMRLRLMIEVRD
jgi:hypothetical protein